MRYFDQIQNKKMKLQLSFLALVLFCSFLIQPMEIIPVSSNSPSLLTLPAGGRQPNPSNPDLIDLWTLRELDLNDSGQVVYAHPSDLISGFCEYQVYNPSGCPGCIDCGIFILSWTPSWPPPAGYYIEIFITMAPTYPGIIQTKAFTFNAPSSVGTYYLYWGGGLQVSYANTANQFTSALAPPAHGVIHVVDPAAPDIDHPADITYEDGTAPPSITWTPSDTDPAYYNITQDGVSIINSSWDGSAITVELENLGLALGTYTFNCSVTDEAGHTISDYVTVAVVDTTPPTINEFTDIEYELGTPEFLIWTPNDLNPAYYNITQDDVPIEGNNWNNNPIALELHTLALTLDSTYIFRCTVHDESGNYAYDTVEVLVTNDTSPPTIDQPRDMSFEVGTSGEYITWTTTDSNPAFYDVTMNGAVLVDEAWTGENIIIDLEALALQRGHYTFTCTVEDTKGHTASDTVEVFVTDSSPPVLDTPGDVSYTEGEMGHTIQWSPTDSSPASFLITQNGLLVLGGPWNGGTISISVDGLNAGVYTYECTVYDEEQNSASDSVLVTVTSTQDSINPVIDSPDDVFYDEGSTGHTVKWTPTEANPASFLVKQNGLYVVGGPWDGDPINISVDGLAAGAYVYECIVYDQAGNSAYDSVLVQVTSLEDTIKPIIDSPSDVSYQEGTNGHKILWIPTDVNPASFLIERDGLIIVGGPWDGDPINISVDNLAVGVYTYVCTVFDQGGNNVSDSVMVEVTSALDTVFPLINSPSDVIYTEGTSGHNVSWIPTDLHPASFLIERDGLLIVGGPWDGSSITICVDGLSAGTYTYSCTVYDQTGNSAMDTVLVEVTSTQDLTDPLIDSPSDLSYEEGTTGNTLSWTPGDTHPASFLVEQDGVFILGGPWDGTLISIYVDNLEVGTYTYTCTVYDEAGNYASDSVVVTVSDTTAPTIDHPPDLTFLEGVTTNTLSWYPSDRNPASCTVTRNGTVILDSIWGGESITIVLDGLEPGNYTFTCTVYDESGNSVSDSVLVSVPESVPTPSSWPSLLVSLVPLFLVVVYYRKRTKPPSG